MLISHAYILLWRSVYLNPLPSPGWCRSVDWVPKGFQLDSQSGHMPQLRARSPGGGVWEATDRCISHKSMFLSLSPSLPLCLKINTIFKKNKNISFAQKFSIYSGYQALIRYKICKHFLPFCGLPFYPVDSVLWCRKVFNFDGVQCVYFSFVACVGVIQGLVAKSNT